MWCWCQGSSAWVALICLPSLVALVSMGDAIRGWMQASHWAAVSFYGGYYRESVPPAEQDSLTVQFSFRSLQDSGVLLIAQIGEGADYLAVVLSTGSQLQVLLSQSGEVSVLGSSNFTTDYSDWQHFELILVNKTLSAKLQALPVSTYTFSASVQVQSVYFGGPESFFAPQYSGFLLPRYYVGCFANLTLNSRPLLLDPSDPGLGAGCCVAPRYPLWCLDSPRANLTLTLPPVRSVTDMLTVSFRLRVTGVKDGLVMLSRTLTSLWSLQLHQGRLQFTANLSDGVHTRYCPGVLADSADWHQIDLVLTSGSIACTVDGVTENSSIFPSLMSSSFFPRVLQLGGASQQMSGRGFVGCLQRLRLDGVDVGRNMIVTGEEAVQPIRIHWNDFSFNTTDLVVTEGSTEKLSSDMWIRLPRDEFTDDLTSLYQQELENAIHFTVKYGPTLGHLYVGQVRASRVDSFDYENILSPDPSLQVAYSHDNPENDTDVVVFRVWAGCADVLFKEEFTTLIISVEERDASLRIRQSENTFRLAVGTRRVITPDFVTVEDPDSADPALISFTVHSVSLLSSSCSSCLVGECDRCEEGREGGDVLRNGDSVKFFHQEDINRGVISFQHYERYSTAPLVIRLGAGLEGSTGGLLDVMISVTPYQGFVNLTSNPEKECVFVREEGLALIASKHLSVFTNFEDQRPVIMYDLLALPKYGILQWLTEDSQWVNLTNSSDQRMTSLGDTPPTYFTQEDVSEGRVRYKQSEPISFSGPETFEFRVRSHNFSSNVTSHLCINVIPYALQFETSIIVHLTHLEVAENGSAPINHTVFNASLAKDELLELLPDLEVDVHQLGIVYTLVEAPSFGRLELQGEILVAGDMFAHRDVTSSALVYFHGGTENHDDRFSFYGEAGSVEYLPIRAPNRTSNLTLDIDITPVNNHAPVLDADMESIQPPEGCWVQVTAHNINVTDMDIPADRLKIYLRKKGSTPTGIFAFRSDPDEAIAQFYMRDVLDQRVIFVHHLSSPLNYTQVLRIDDGVSMHTIRKPIVIAAVPLILDVSLALPLNSQCFGSIDADQEDLQVQFGSKFSATLCDQFGNNADLVPSITVTIVESPQHGHVARLDNSSSPVSQFLFSNLSNLVYVLGNRNANGDELVLEFSHGHSSPIRRTLVLCIQPVLVPLDLRVATLQLMQGGMAHITTEHLAVNSSREELKDHLVFHVVGGPRHGGSLLNDDIFSDMSLSQFTHGDLTNLSIVYDSHNAPHTQDSILLRLCSPLIMSCLPEQELLIEIHPTRLTVQNSTIHVREGTIYPFKERDFNVSAPPDYDINIVIFKNPEYGELFIQTPFSNSPASYFRLEDVSKLRYNNSDLENLMDRVEVNVEAEDGTGGPPQLVQFILWIVIEPVNHHAPEVVRPVESLTVVQGGTVPITASIFSAHDFDAGSDDDDLQWSVVYPQISGYLFLEGRETEVVSSWKEGDIRNNRLYYRNTISRTDIFILRVSDGEKHAPLELVIYIVLVNFKKYPVDAFRLEEGGQKRITYTHLRYYADNDGSLTDSDFLITIQNKPVHGQLTLDGRPLRPNDHFTQEHINSSRLVYSHDHSNTVSDSFVFVISVPARQNGSTIGTFLMEIDAVDDDAPVANIPERMFVVELHRVAINVNITDADSRTKVESDRVIGQLVQPLVHGRLEKVRHGLQINHTETFTKYDLENHRVWYHQLGLHHMRPDHLVFNLTDGINRQSTVYNLTIIILPQIVSLKLSPLTVTEETIAVITYEEIVVNHPYLSTVEGAITLVEGRGPRHGKLVNTKTESQSDEEIYFFTTGDITNKSISYYHNGAESSRDSFDFVYEALEPPGYGRRSAVETFYIDIINVNDQRPVIHGNPSLKLWATETVVLDEQYLNITDYDTPPSKLNITVQIQTIGGYIAFANNTAISIYWFTQADVRARRIMFVHVDGPEGLITYNVTDGDYNETGIIPIYADTLALECLVHQWRGIEVAFLRTALVTRANLHCTTSDGLNDREITYRIPDSLLGHFEVDSETRSEFNSTEVDAGLVMFVHTETGLWMERETLSVFASSHPASPESDLPLVIEVRYPHPPPGSRLAVNRGLNLTEGGSAVIDESNLDGRNLRYAAWMALQSPVDTPPRDLLVVYHIVQSPRGNLTLDGNLVSSFTQRDLASARVLYTHDDSEVLSEVLLLNVTVQLPNGTLVARHDLESVNITVSPINDQWPLLQTAALEKALVKNFDALLTSFDLEVTDGDNGPKQVQLVLLSVPNNTVVLLNGSALTANSTVSQHDINQLSVSLHPFSVGVSSFTFTFTDGTWTSEGVMEFVLSVEDHYLHQVNSKEIVSFQNETAGPVISSAYLDTRTNGRRSQTVFTVRGAPCCGHIMLSGREVLTFTQEDIDRSLVSYLPQRDTYQDGFSLNISNHNQSLSADVSISIVALGHTDETNVVHFNGDPSHLVQVLPLDVLLLDELIKVTSSIPTIEVLKPPTYGHLERRIPLTADVSIRKRTTDEIREFRYDDLQHGWIVYVLDSSVAVENDTESFEVLVRAKGVLPGKAVITFTLSPPPLLPVTSDPSNVPSTTPSDTAAGGQSVSPAGSESGGGFPVYTLVPIIGIILFLLLLIVVVVAFCLTQQKRIKKKWVPTFAHLHHQSSPWSASSPPIPTQVAHYDFDPSGMPSSENDYHNSDTSSGFSEPDCSPRQTPVHSSHPPPPLCSSPSYHPPRSRMRSNVSITFSSRQSAVSEEMSVDGETFVHSSLSQYPPQTSAVVPLPVRPASHTAFNRPSVLDSGMVSLNSGEIPALEEDKAVDSHKDNDGACAEWREGEALPDFSDLNVQRLFHAHNPVLKKEEYWV